jgi:hypothetical protein
MKGIVALIMSLVVIVSFSQAQTIPDKPNIDKLCGCFDVTFKYAETFSPDKNYKYHDREEISGGTELIIPVEVSDKRIVLQHLLIITDSMIIKHWREDWTYENPEFWAYKGNKTWVKEVQAADKVKGKWTQSIWEVSDAPRYQGASAWIKANNSTFWLNTTDAPLPRREYTVRNDYNILRRTNRLVLLDSGYVHEQDNQKIILKENGEEQLLVEEKGINSYKRLPDVECAAGKYYWEQNKDYWTTVRHVWEKYIATQSKIELKTKVDGKVLHDHLFALADEYRKTKVPAAVLEAKIKAFLDVYIGHEEKKVATK